MRYLRNEDGVALVTALMLTLIALAITMALLYMVIAGTKMSGAQKRYKSSYEASYATATEMYPKDILPSLIVGFMNYSSPSTATSSVAARFASISMDIPVGNSNCLKQKVSSDPSSWSACTAASKSTDPKNSPDMTFKLRGLPAQQGFNLFAKIVDNVPGMSDMSGVELDSGMGVVSNNNNPAVFHQPTLFTFAVQGERETSSKEKAIFEVLYAY